MKRMVACIALAFLLIGCAGMNDALTPGVKVQHDDFDNATIIYQAPVSAATLGDAWNTLGFDWTSNTPNKVYLTVGVQGVSNISSVKFKADGVMIDKAIPAAVGTDYADTTLGMMLNYGVGSKTTSTRRFAVSMEDFRKIASANDVRMRVGMINTYNTSKFGPAHGVVIINTKFAPFLAQIDAAMGSK